VIDTTELNHAQHAPKAPSARRLRLLAPPPMRFRLRERRGLGLATCDLRLATLGTIPFMPVDFDISRVAHLARIALTEDELERYTEQLEQILEHAARVQALPTDGIEPTSHPLTMVNAFRSDEVTACLDRDEVLAEAPDPEDGYFRVPRILGDE